jgi:hypothetical protein
LKGEVIGATDGSFTIDAVFGPDPGGLHIDTIDLFDGSFARVFRDQSRIDLRLANYVQDVGVQGGQNEVEVFWQNATILGTPGLSSITVEPDSDLLRTAKSPTPLHLEGVHTLTAHAGEVLTVPFDLVADDERVAGPVRVNAIATGPGVELLDREVIVPAVPGLRVRHDQLRVRLTTGGTHQVVLTAHSPINDPAWPVTIIVK